MQPNQPYLEIARKKELTVAELLLRYLSLEGVVDIFGVPGTSLAYLLYALKHQQDRFTYHICRHESGAGYMADGYARVTGTLGVVIVSSGPSATNALSGSAVAQACNSPVLVISGEVAQSAFGKGGFQEGIDATLNINAIYRNADHYSAVITSAGNFQTLFAQALRTSLSLPRGASHISLPLDVGGETLADDAYIPRSAQNYRAVPKGSNPEAATRVMTVLAKARRPLIFLGNGCRGALLHATRLSDEARATITARMTGFQRLVEKFAVPVMTTPNGKGLFPESHSLSLRNYGFGGSNWGGAYIGAADPAAGPYDALVILGSSLTEKTTNSWNRALIPDGPIVQVDLDQRVIGRGFPIAFGVVAETGAFIDDLIRCGETMAPNPSIIEPRLDLIQRVRNTPAAPPSSAPENQLVGAINRLVPSGSQLFIDASVCAPASLGYMTIDPPTQIHNAFNMEPMGWAPAAVVGAAIGAPETVCVSISGDGGFMMNGNEVSTAARYGVGAVWVVYNNDVLADVELHLEKEFGGDGWMDLYQLGAPDLVRLAQGLGADAVEVRSVAAFEQAFPTAIDDARLKHKPQVVIVRPETRAPATTNSTPNR